MELTIKEVAQVCGGRLVLTDRSRQEGKVSGVVLDSRQVAEGSIFVATVGERVDGHRFIPQVFEQGAALVLTEKTPEQVAEEQGMDCSAWGSYLQVENSFQALKDLAEYYRSKLTIPVVGITGSVGKTSTKEFIAGVLAQKYRVLKTEGNFNNEIGVPLTLLRIRKEHQAAVIEMGISEFGEMHRLSKMVRPDICVITNIGQCHLENLKDRDGILRAKTEIFDYMAENGRVCLNGEDDKLCTIGQVKGKQPLFFGLNGQSGEQCYATDIRSRGLWGSQAILHMEKDGEEHTFPVEVPLPGIHMVTNAAAAACVAGELGLNEEEIAEGIRKVEAISGRTHLIRLPYCTLIDDCYNANPVSMKSAIDLLMLADTETVAVLGDMFELGENSEAMHTEVGSYAARAGVNHILCVGELSASMYEGAAKDASRSQTVIYYPDRDSLLKALPDVLPEGSTILLKASHGMGFAEVLAFLESRFSAS